MPQKTRHKPKQEQEGAAQVPVAAPPITCQRAPRKKASEPSEEAASQPLQPSTTQARKRKRHTRTASTASTASQPRVKEPARQPRRVEAPRQPRRQEEPKAKPKKPAEPSNALEKRAKPWLEEPPEGFVVRTQRLTLDRLFILGHTITGVNDNPVISFDIVGSTGNIYNTIIRKVPTCDCPDARFRRAQCKHICYVLANALRAPPNLQYQQSFLSSELRDIWEASPLNRFDRAATANDDGRRKPVEGDCPICFMEFEANEEIVWCRSSCGNNIHKGCFQKWAEQGSQNPVRCVYCRAEWKSDDNTRDVESIRREGIVGPLGYVNVGLQLDRLARRRGYSTSSPSSTSPQSPSSG